MKKRKSQNQDIDIDTTLSEVTTAEVEETANDSAAEEKVQKKNKILGTIFSILSVVFPAIAIVLSIAYPFIAIIGFPFSVIFGFIIGAATVFGGLFFCLIPILGWILGPILMILGILLMLALMLQSFWLPIVIYVLLIASSFAFSIISLKKGHKLGTLGMILAVVSILLAIILVIALIAIIAVIVFLSVGGPAMLPI